MAGETNGTVVAPVAGPPPGAVQVKVVANIRLENVPGDRVTMMLLGDTMPEIAVALPPDKARELAAALIVHAEQVDAMGRRIILPGDPEAGGLPHGR